LRAAASKLKRVISPRLYYAVIYHETTKRSLQRAAAAAAAAYQIHTITRDNLHLNNNVELPSNAIPPLRILSFNYSIQIKKGNNGDASSKERRGKSRAT